MALGRLFGGIIGGAAKGTLAAGKLAGRGAYHASRFGVETTAGMAQGAANIGRRAMGRQPIDMLSSAAQTGGARFGARIVSNQNLGRMGHAAGTAGMVAGRTAYHAGTAIGGAGLMAGRVGSKAFNVVPRTLPNPLGLEMKRGARWAVGLGALGIGGGFGYRDYQRQRRMGTVYPQGQMRELDYDAVPNVQQGANDLGATGDLVFAMNNLR